MNKNLKQLFSNLKPPEPPTELFDRIILAIKREQELQHTKRLLFGFLFLLITSLITTPFSGAMLVEQVENSGIFYFLSTAVSDFGTFLAIWQNFSLAILESLPLAGMLVFAISLGISVFTLRLFLHRKRLLIGYLMHSFV